MKFENKTRSLKSLLVVFGVLISCPAILTGADKSILVQNGQKVAFMGDSITANGWGMPGGYVKLIVDALDKEGIKVTPIAAGVSGNTSKDMLARLDRDVLSKKPDWMTLSCGVNDVWHGVNGVDLETYKKNITSIIDQATAAGIKVVVLTSTPIGEDDNDNNKKLVAYNDFLRQLAKERKLPLVDLNADFETLLAPLAPTGLSRNFTVDGVHMNPEGNLIMAKGVLGAFGVSAADFAGFEQAWLDQPGTAFLTAGNLDPRPNNMPVTLAQFRAVEKVAKASNVNFEQMFASLTLQAIGEVMQGHLQDPVVDVDAIRKEISDKVQQKIEGLALPAAPAPASPAKNT
jgi:lysophospholipase L1-like esterase